jgi:delta24-sterol reductase
MILGNGDVVWASAEEHRDLFFTAAGSCGSLGVITLLEMELIDARSNVELQYMPVTSTQEAVQQLRRYQEDPDVNYMDGIMYSMTSGVIMIGRLTNITIAGKTQRFDRAQDPWFYMHAEEILKKIEGDGSDYRETIPAQTYLFRYDRGVFWSGTRAFKYFVTPFNRITRYLLDPFMYSRTMVHALLRHRVQNDHPRLWSTVRCSRGVCSMDGRAYGHLATLAMPRQIGAARRTKFLTRQQHKG